MLLCSGSTTLLPALGDEYTAAAHRDSSIDRVRLQRQHSISPQRSTGGPGLCPVAAVDYAPGGLSRRVLGTLAPFEAGRVIAGITTAWLWIGIA